MLKTKKTSPKKIKTPQQAANEKSSKRRGTLLRKSLEIAKLCGVHVSMVIEDQEGNFYTYKTKKQQNWPPANIVRTSSNYIESRTNGARLPQSSKTL